MRGKLITFEGIDGAGKSTIVSLLRSSGSMEDVVFTREPTDSWLGRTVETAIHSDTDHLAELFLFTADHAQHISKVIRPAVNNGISVISDRYSDSTYAYQGMTLAGMFDDPVKWAQDIRKEWTIIPDLTILLDIDPAIAVKRCGNRGEQTKFEKLEFLQGVRSNYLRLAEQDPDRFIVVDSSGSAKEVAEKISLIISPLLEK